MEPHLPGPTAPPPVDWPGGRRGFPSRGMPIPPPFAVTWERAPSPSPGTSVAWPTSAWRRRPAPRAACDRSAAQHPRGPSRRDSPWLRWWNRPPATRMRTPLRWDARKAEGTMTQRWLHTPPCHGLWQPSLTGRNQVQQHPRAVAHACSVQRRERLQHHSVRLLCRRWQPCAT